MKRIKIKMTLLEGMLGAIPSSEEIYTDYIASKAPDGDDSEQETDDYNVSEEVQRGTTVFLRDENDMPYVYDYTIRGYFKDTCGSLRKVKDTKSSKLGNYKKVIDGLVFVEPRKIVINLAGEITLCQRPLRANTPKGERVALASSEEVPAGSTLEFTILLFKEDLEGLIYEWLDMGIYRGTGQWRNSGKGKFTYEVVDIS